MVTHLKMGKSVRKSGSVSGATIIRRRQKETFHKCVSTSLPRLWEEKQQLVVRYNPGKYFLKHTTNYVNIFVKHVKNCPC